MADPPLVAFVAGAPAVGCTPPEVVGTDAAEPAPPLLVSPVVADVSPPVSLGVEPVVVDEPVAVLDPVDDVDEVGVEEVVFPVCLPSGGGSVSSPLAAAAAADAAPLSIANWLASRVTERFT